MNRTQIPILKNFKVQESFVLLFSILILFSQRAQGQSSSVFTTFDGVTEDSYVSYLNLNGTNGATIAIPNSPALHQDLEYTIMLWFKPTSDNWGKRLQYAFKIKDSIECYFTESASLICESFEKCDKLIVSVQSVPQNYWTHLTISGNLNSGSYLSLETNTNPMVAFDEKSYVIMRQIYWDWYGCIGNCDSQFGFIGGLREFIFIGQYLSRDTTSRIKNNLLSFDGTMQAYYRFNEASFNKDLYREQYAVVNISNLAFDYIPNDICSALQNYTNVLSVDRDWAAQTITIDGRWSPNQRIYEYSAAITLRIEDDSCYISNPYDARNFCNIFLLDEAFMLYLDTKNSFRFYFFALKNYYETQSRSIFIPQNEWLNIQVSFSRYDGYNVRVYDMRGKMIGYDFEDRDMYDQFPNKQFRIFQNFRGQIKSFILFTSAKTLPIKIPERNQTSPDALLFWKFDNQFIQDQVIQGLTPSSPIPLILSNKPSFEAVQWMNFDFNSGSTEGLTSYPYALFDGISCKDENLTPLLTGTSSNFIAQTTKIEELIQSMTVEFWFRPASTIQANQFLFTMVEQESSKEVFQIYTNTDLTLTCSPFGNYSVRDPSIKYTSYTQPTVVQSNWFHLTCTFTLQNKTQGFLYSSFIKEQSYTEDLSQTEYYFTKNTSYFVIVGNNQNLMSGTSMRVKELRVWPEVRTLSQIQQWRYQQFDQSSYFPKTLLAYLRLTEGGHREFNFANSFNKTTPRNISQQGVKYVVDQDLLVCPIQTYPIDGKCFLNPVSQAVAAFIPIHNPILGTNLTWMITANFSVLMNQTYFSTLDVRFKAESAVIQYLATQSALKYDLLIPATAFRSEDAYPITLVFQNKAMTFQNSQQIQFVPNNCKYYKMNNSDAYSSYLFYNQSMGASNISMTIVPQLVRTYCNDISFYRDLSHYVTYFISPELPQKPNLEFTFDQSDNIRVIIPAGEQYKFPQKKDVKIFFQIYYTNKIYQGLVNTTMFKFQDVIQTIYFNIPPQTVALSLTIDKPYVLKYETVTLDASGTQITGFTSGDQGNLTYQWICPTNDSLYICKDQTGSKLEIRSYQVLANFLNYSQYYDFTVQVTWTRPNGNKEVFNATQKVIWYNVVTPQFTIYQPATVKSTAENIFSLKFDNYNSTDLQNMSITWSIIPNLTIPTLALRKNNTELVVAKGGFATETNYILSVTAQDVTFALAKKSSSLSFKTSSPPFGGSARITPQSGNLTTTQFNISISGWRSNNEPIKFRAWYGESPNSNVPYQLIYQNWTAANQNLTFFATTVNSIIVEITDNSTESQYIILTPNITAQPSPNITNMIQKAIEQSSNVFQRQSYLNSAASSINSQCSANIYPSEEQIREHIQQKLSIIEELEKDIQSIQDGKSLNNADASHIIFQTVKTLGTLVEQDLYLNDFIVGKSINISSEILKNKKTFKDLLLVSSDFDVKFLNIISNLLTYIDSKAYQAQDNRLLYDSTTLTGIQQLFLEALQLKDLFQQILCDAQTSSYVEPRDVFTRNIEIIISKFRHSQDIPSRSFTQDDGKNLDIGYNFISRVNLFINDIMNEAVQFKSLDQNSEVCVQTSFLKVNPYPLNKQERIHLKQYSQSFVDFKVTDATGEKTIFKNNELSPFSEVLFLINEDTFVNNQTVCMSYNDHWQEKYCQTQVDTQNFQVICDCNHINSHYYALFTDSSRNQGQNLQFPDIEFRENRVSESSLAYLGIVSFLAVSGVAFTIIAISQDKKDFRKCQEPIKSQFKLDLLLNVSKLSEKPLSLWYYKQQDVFSYSLSQNSLFMQMLINTHPILNFINKFDFQRPRITRFSLYFFQICFTALVSTLWFGKYYRVDDMSRMNGQIDQKDIDSILIVGLIGSILVLPLPVCFKGGLKHNQDIDNQVHATQYTSNTIHNSPKKITNIILQQAKGQISAVPQKQKLGKIITISLLCLSCLIIAIIIALSQQIPIANQQCMLTCFYLALVFGLFVTNLIRVILNYLLVQKDNSCFRFFTAFYAQEVYVDMGHVKRAEEKIIEKINQENNVESLDLKQENNSQNTTNMRKLSTNKICSDASIEINKSRCEGLPELVEYVQATPFENKFGDGVNLDESLPSEKATSKKLFPIYNSKTPERRSSKGTDSQKVIYEKV